MKKTFCLFSVFIVSCLTVDCIIPFSSAFAKDKKSLARCICGSKIELQPQFKECVKDSRQFFFKENKYSGYVEFLKGLCPDNKFIAPYLSYEVALARYEQLKFLEGRNEWDEYFSKGNDYRDDIVGGLEDCLKALDKLDPAYLYAQLLSYKFHKDQQDSFTQEALASLMESAKGYAQSKNDMQPVKDIADALLSYQEKTSAKELYNIFAQGLIASVTNEAELKKAALGFLGEGNIELSETLFDKYIERIKGVYPKDKFLQELKEIAKTFSYKDGQLNDMVYAESVFSRIADAGGADAFDEELIYLRGFNLEKNKDFKEAKEIYAGLLFKYPDSRYADKLAYKIGLINIYILRDVALARENLGQLSDKKTAGPYSLLSLYQLGLLKQWEKDFPSARGYYSKLLEKSEGSDINVVVMARQRLKEIEEGGLLEKNLKALLDAALSPEYAGLNMSKVEFKPDVYLPKKGGEINVASSVYISSSGCFHVETEYLWSGDLGASSPNSKEQGFSTSYNDEGVKMIGLVLVSPSGIEDYSLDLIDVQ